jgi:hypothetical protein
MMLEKARISAFFTSYRNKLDTLINATKYKDGIYYEAEWTIHISNFMDQVKNDVDEGIIKFSLLGDTISVAPKGVEFDVIPYCWMMLTISIPPNMYGRAIDTFNNTRYAYDGQQVISLVNTLDKSSIDAFKDYYYKVVSYFLAVIRVTEPYIDGQYPSVMEQMQSSACGNLFYFPAWQYSPSMAYLCSILNTAPVDSLLKMDNVDGDCYKTSALQLVQQLFCNNAQKIMSPLVECFGASELCKLWAYQHYPLCRVTYLPITDGNINFPDTYNICQKIHRIRSIYKPDYISRSLHCIINLYNTEDEISKHIIMAMLGPVPFFFDSELVMYDDVVFVDDPKSDLLSISHEPVPLLDGPVKKWRLDSIPYERRVEATLLYTEFLFQENLINFEHQQDAVLYAQGMTVEDWYWLSS